MMPIFDKVFVSKFVDNDGGPTILFAQDVGVDPAINIMFLERTEVSVEV
jgi:hypothetical protein